MVQCPCGHVWRSVVGMTRYRRSCPRCSGSTGFKRIDRRLDNQKRVSSKRSGYRGDARANPLPDSGVTKPGPAAGGMFAEVPPCP